MFPDGRTSPLQELQMTTVLDDNIFNLAVDGSFDDCQQLLKSAFNDLQFKQAFSLGAVNSVNWARVLAQVVYYFWAWYQLRCPAEFDVTVPTGNFGNIFAGYLAKKMGLPVRQINLATNDNDILARFFRSGIYERGSVHFLSPAMDIQVASNFERYLFQLGGDAEGVKTFMSGFQESQTSTLEHLHGDFDWFQAGAVTDAETVATIEKVFDQFGYLADPHTSVGIAIAEQYQRDDVPMVAVATAHPAKFVEAVGQALPRTPNHHPTLQALSGKETRRYDLAASEASLKTFIEGALRLVLLDALNRCRQFFQVMDKRSDSWARPPASSRRRLKPHRENAERSSSLNVKRWIIAYIDHLTGLTLCGLQGFQE